MSPLVLEEPFEWLDAMPGLYGVAGSPATRQEIVITDGHDAVIATLGQDEALDLGKRLLRLAEKMQPGTTGWAIDGEVGWRPQLRRRASVDDELRDRDV